MTGIDFARLVRKYTRTNSITLTDSDLVLFANTVKNDFVRSIIKKDEDYFVFDTYANLKASSAVDPTSREYLLPTDSRKIVRVEAKFDGTNWIKLTEFDLVKYTRTSDELTITQLFSNSSGVASYDLIGSLLKLYTGTVSVVSGGLKLTYVALPRDITIDSLALETDLSVAASATDGAMPSPFHELWARKIGIIYKSSQEKPILLSEYDKAFGPDFQEVLDSIKDPNLDREVTFSLPDDTYYQN